MHTIRDLRIRALSAVLVSLFFFCAAAAVPAGTDEEENSPPPCPKPYIKSITPRAVSAGEAIKIRGSRFGSTPGSVVFASGPDAIIISWSRKRIYAAVPEGTPSGPVTVYSSCGPASNQVHLTIKPASEEDGDEVTSPDDTDLEE